MRAKHWTILLAWKYAKVILYWKMLAGIAVSAAIVEVVADLADLAHLFRPQSVELLLFANLMIGFDAATRIATLFHPAPGEYRGLKNSGFRFKRLLDTGFKFGMYNFVFLMTNYTSGVASRQVVNEYGWFIDGMLVLMIGLGPGTYVLFGMWEFLSGLRHIAKMLPAVQRLLDLIQRREPILESHKDPSEV